MSNKDKYVLFQRLVATICCFALSSILLIFNWHNLFFIKIEDSGDPWKWMIYRLMWCFASAFIGVGLRSALMIKEKKFPLEEYFVYFVLLVGSCILVFSILHIFDQTKNQIFYPLAFSICLLIGFDAFRLKELTKKLLESFKK